MFVANYSGNFAEPHTGNGRGRFAPVNIDYCVATMGKVRGRLAFLCVHAVYLSFCASSIKFCTPGCPALLAWVRLRSRSARATVSSQGRNNHAPSPRYAAIHALQLRSKPEASSYWPFEWPTPGATL